MVSWRIKWNDYYAVLGVERTASVEKIKKMYHKLVAEYHPDVCKSEETHEKITLINEAYEILSDKKLKKEYDSVWDSKYSLDHFNTQGNAVTANSNVNYSEEEDYIGFGQMGDRKIVVKKIVDEAMGKNQILENLQIIMDIRKDIVLKAYFGYIEQEEYFNKVKELVDIGASFIDYLRTLLSKYNLSGLINLIHLIIRDLQKDVINLPLDIDKIRKGKLKIDEETDVCSIYAGNVKLSSISMDIDKTPIDKKAVDSEIEFKIIEEWFEKITFFAIIHSFSFSLGAFETKENIYEYDRFCFQVMETELLPKEIANKFPGFDKMVSYSHVELLISNYRLEKIKQMAFQKYLENRLEFLNQNNNVKKFNISTFNNITQYKKNVRDNIEFIDFYLMGRNDNFFQEYELPFFESLISLKLGEYGELVELESCLTKISDPIKMCRFSFGDFEIYFDLREDLIDIVNNVVRKHNQQFPRLRRVLSLHNQEVVQLRMLGFSDNNE